MLVSKRFVLISLVVIVLGTMSGYYVFKRNFQASSLKKVSVNEAALDKAFEEASGMRRMSTVEPLISPGTQESKDQRNLLSFMDKEISVNADSSVIMPHENAKKMYVDVNSNFKPLSSFSPRNSNEKVSSEIKEKLKTSKSVPVIVTLNQESIYQPNNSKDNNLKTKQSLEQSTETIKNKLGKNISVKKSLFVISGFSADINKEGLEALSQDPNVKRVSLDKEVKATLDTSPTQINADKVWRTVVNGSAITGKGVKIAIIDTGVDYRHPDLGGCMGANCRVIEGFDFVNNDNDPIDDQGHGTHVAATAAGKGTLDGIAPDANVVVYKVLDSAGSGSTSNVISAIERTADPNQDGDTSDHLDIASLSLGGYGDANDDGSLAVDRISALGVTFTIAAGNSGPAGSTISSPGTARSAITVAAACSEAQSQDPTNGYCYNNKIASFSSRGPALIGTEDTHKPDIAAPGVLICAARLDNSFPSSPTCFDENHIRISGTSMATPHVAGAVALMKQVNPNLTPQQIKQLLKDTATNLGAEYNLQGAGLINVKAAIGKDSPVLSNPEFFNISTNPTISTSTHRQIFQVTSSVNISNLSLEVDMPSVNGLTIALSTRTLNLVNNKGSYTITVNVDNNKVKPGPYRAKVYYKNNNVLIGLVPININVLPTIVLSKQSVDFGNDLPSNVSWASAVESFTIKNLRQDVAQSVDISSGFISNIIATVSTSAPIKQFILKPNETKTLKVNLTVPSNSSLPNNVYKSSISFTSNSCQQNSTNLQPTPGTPMSFLSGNIALAAPRPAPSSPLCSGIIYQKKEVNNLRAQFTKYYAFEVNNNVTPYEDKNVFASSFAIEDKATGAFYYRNIISGYNLVLVDSPGPYDIKTWSDFFTTKDSAVIVWITSYKNLIANNGIVVMNIDLVPEGKNMITVEPNDIRGNSFEAINMLSINQKTGWFTTTWQTSSKAKFFVNDRTEVAMSGYSFIYYENMPNKNERYHYHFPLQEITNSVNFKVDWNKYKKSIIDFSSMDFSDSQTLLPVITYQSPLSDYLGYRTWHDQHTLSQGENLELYSYNTISQFITINTNYRDDLYYLCNQGGSLPNICSTMYESPRLYLFDNKAMIGFFYNKEYIDFPGDTVYLGTGPVYWTGKFNRSEYECRMDPDQGQYICGYFINAISSNIYMQPVPFLKQDFTQQVFVPSIPYTISRNGEIVSSRNLNRFEGPNTMDLFNYYLQDDGLYTFKVDEFNYLIQKKPMKASVRTSFNTAKADPNPPFIRSLKYLNSDKPTQVYMNSNDVLEVDIDPNGGQNNYIKISYSTNGQDFTVLPVTNQSGKFIADIPEIPYCEKVSFKLEAKDDSDNELIYTFEIPYGPNTTP